ncbi:MAG: hypothetical protein IKV81_01995 [Clostridia bacterium]|nr:hypothetical protein [Clostridia bacterium]
MKTNADARNYETTQEIVNDALMILWAWQPCPISKVTNNMNTYLSSWYREYQLNQEELKEIENAVKEWF